MNNTKLLKIIILIITTFNINIEPNEPETSKPLTEPIRQISYPDLRADYTKNILNILQGSKLEKYTSEHLLPDVVYRVIFAPIYDLSKDEKIRLAKGIEIIISFKDSKHGPNDYIHPFNESNQNLIKIYRSIRKIYYSIKDSGFEENSIKFLILVRKFIYLFLSDQPFPKEIDNFQQATTRAASPDIGTFSDISYIFNLIISGANNFKQK